MTSRDDPSHQRLLRLASTQTHADPDVAECWELVLQGLKGGFFGVDHLEEIAAVLEAGSGRGADEISFDAEGDQAVVFFVNTSCRCPLAPFVAALRELHRRYLMDPGAEHDARSGREDSPRAPPRPPDEAQLQEVLRLLFSLLAGAAPEPGPQDESRLSPELRERVARVRELARRVRVAPHTADFRAGAGATPSLSPRLQALIGPLYEGLSGIYQEEQKRDPEVLRQWLRMLTSWRNGEAAAGPQLDLLLQRLEEKMGPLLQPPGASASQKKEALHARVRQSIRGALKKRGFPVDD